MIETPVPDFFQEDTDDALRLQLGWMDEQLGLETVFFAGMLRTSSDAIVRWLRGEQPLADDQRMTLRRFWRSMLHVLSFVGNDCGKARNFLNWEPPAMDQTQQTALTPPWSGSSLRDHLKDKGAHAIDCLNSWVLQCRFGNPCAA